MSKPPPETENAESRSEKDQKSHSVSSAHSSDRAEPSNTEHVPELIIDGNEISSPTSTPVVPLEVKIEQYERPVVPVSMSSIELSELTKQGNEPPPRVARLRSMSTMNLETTEEVSQRVARSLSRAVYHTPPSGVLQRVASSEQLRTTARAGSDALSAFHVSRDSLDEPDFVRAAHVPAAPVGPEVVSIYRGMWHTCTVDEVLHRVGTSLETGLTHAEAAERLRVFGPNILKGANQSANAVILFLKNLFGFLSILLMVAMILAFVTHEYVEGGVLAFIIIFNSLVGFIQEYRSEKTLDALKKLTASVCRVLRQGKVQEINAVDLVVGDVVVLDIGDGCPADLRLSETVKMEIDESTLTGESLPVRKRSGPLPATSTFTPLGDRVNMGYSGCYVTMGRGRGIVVATGSKTELGMIAKGATEDTKGASHLSREIRNLSIVLFSSGIVFAIVVFAANRFVFSNEILIYAITLIIAVIPESLPVMLTLTMAMGMRRMAERNAIVRRVGVLETLGRVTDICSDKTGTLTQAKMAAVNLWLPHRAYIVTGLAMSDKGEFRDAHNDITALDPCAVNLLECAALCNNATIEPKPDGTGLRGVGSPTEIALAFLALKGGFVRTKMIEERKWRMTAEWPFDSTTKSMTIVYKNPSVAAITHNAYMKGAPEKVILACRFIATPSGPIPMHDDFLPALKSAMANMTSRGQRVIAVAYRPNFPFKATLTPPRSEVDMDMVFLGLVGIWDPPRAESAPAVAVCHNAGIVVHMLTGDHPSTAVAIAFDIGILRAGEKEADLAMVAPEFDALTTEQTDQMVELPRVLARCAPETKVKMVRALRHRERISVMTGDGVNDAPALKTADVGVAMGSGSEVTKQAADLVLTDDNFASIVAAVEEGRRIFVNIKKFVVHEITSNVASILVLVVSLAFRDPLDFSVNPLSALQTIWINTLIVAMPSLALSREPNDSDAMLRPPDFKNRGILSREVIADIVVYGILIGALSLVSFVFVLYWGYAGVIGTGCNDTITFACVPTYRARATTFVTFALLLLINAFDCRDSRKYIWQMPLHENKALLIAFGIGVASLVALVYIPYVNTILLRHWPIDWEWAVAAVAGVALIIFVQIYKIIKNRFWPLLSTAELRNLQHLY